MWLIDELKIIETLISNELNFNTMEITVDYKLLENKIPIKLAVVIQKYKK